MTLPLPGRERWQPLRAGLVDVFHYDVEELAFKDGHLLLRGNNGTGKSKVLALLLPFLLEGDTSSHRVEPDGDPGKRMEWNLLLGGRHPHTERTGYVWCELGRLDAGEPRFLTIGAGLKAVAGRTGVRSWFFVTDRRVGPDLHLVGEDRTVLTRERLAVALGERGRVFDSAARYRTAVNEALFDLSPERYEALLTLLVQLRQPQLSKKPDERRLSTALTEALPPLDTAVVADVAEAFRSLQDERDALTAHSEARDAAVAFLATYQDYARVTVRREAEAPRRAQSRYEDTGRRLAAARDVLVRAQAEEAAAAEAAERVRRAHADATEREKVLRASPEMRSADELRRAGEEARRATDRDALAGDERDRADADLADRRAGHATAGEQHARAETAASEAVQGAARTAADAGVPAPSLELAETATDAARARAERDVASRRRAVAQVLQLTEASARTRTELVEAERDRDGAARDADTAHQAHATAEAALSEATDAFVAATDAWLRDAAALRRAVPDALDVDAVARVAARVADWVDSLDGNDPLDAAAQAAGRGAVSRLGARTADLVAQDRALADQVDELADVRERLLTGEDMAPEPVPTRDVASRDARPGAPLWRLVDFRADVAARDRAGLEAALEAAGLLDAWVTPDGGLLDADDAVVTTSAQVSPSVADVLTPAVDRGDPQASTLPDDVVAGVLAGIGLGAATGPTWVDPSGRYRIGSVEGRWRKDAAAFIGAGARDRARRERLAAIDAELDDLAARRAAVTATRAQVDEQRREVESELAALPRPGGLRHAHSTLQERTSRLAAAREALEGADATAAAARRRHDAALAEVRAAAAERRLPDDADGLRRVERALTEHTVALAGLWPAVAALATAAEALGRAAVEVERAESRLQQRCALAEASGRERDTAVSRAASLRESVGAAVEQLEAQLAEVTRDLRAADAESEALHRKRRELANAVGQASGRAEELAGQLDRDASARHDASDRLRAVARTGLLHAAVPDVDVPDPEADWSPTPTVLLARAVESALSGVRADDEAAERVTSRLVEGLSALGDVLSRSGDSVAHVPGDAGITVTVTFRGRSTTTAGLAAELDAELAERERILSARERDLLEKHLVDDVAARLQELIRAAERQVAAMNDELARRPTSTGMQLRFQWRASENAPTGLAEARARLLRQTSDAWSEDDRTAVGAFLQAQVAAVRAADEGGTWFDHLTAALDYRAWHRFVVELRQDGRWRPATGPASGGERVLAATVPLFAAAASHYASAGSPHAPRLVLLDEAFAGVDDDSRAKCFGLLAEFDLDYVLTSEREWGCYPTVPGLAIAHLSRREGVDAVLVTRWEWDGSARRRVADPGVSAAAPVPSPSQQVPSGVEALWT